MQKTIKRILLLIILFCTFVFINYAYAETDEDVTGKFTDENLKNAIIEIIRKVENNSEKSNILMSDINTITADSLASGKQLNLAGKNISSLNGLELFANKNIEWIYLDWNNIEDMSILANFTSLTKISASGNNVSNISFLAKLENLQNLNLNNNKIKDISILENLTKLRYLCLDNNQIENIDVLQDLTKLREVSISGNKIKNADVLTKLLLIENIDVSRNNIESIKGFATNNAVKKINLNYNNLSSLDGVDKLTGLEILSASNNKITDINAITNLTKLYNLNLNKNEIQDISELNNNETIKYLYLDSNHIIDSNPIETLANVAKFTVYNQTYNLNLSGSFKTDELQVNLTSMFQSLQNKNSKLYNENIKFKMEPSITYEIATDMSFFIVKVNDLEKQDLTFSMKDDEYNYITLFIHYDKPTEPDNSSNVVKNEATSNVVKNNTVSNKIQNNTTNGNGSNSSNSNIVDDSNSDKSDELSNVYKIQDGYVKNVETGTNVGKFVGNLNTGQVRITRKNSALATTETVATGDILNANNKNYIIIVKADPSGDGKTNIMDLMKVKRHVVGSNNLSTIESLAADLNGDGKINIMDIMNFVKIITKQK